MMTEMKRWQRAHQQGYDDVKNDTHTLEIAQDPKEYEFYLKGRKDAGEAKAVNPKLQISDSGYQRQLADDSSPLPEVL